MAAVAPATSAAGARSGVIRVGRIPGLLLGALTLGAVAGVGLFQVVQTSRAATAGYEIRSLEAERDVLSAEIRIAEADVAQMAQVERVRDEAINRLGMVEPADHVKIAVGAPAPAVIPLPQRYVPRVEAFEPVPIPWWQRLTSRIPGFD